MTIVTPYMLRKKLHEVNNMSSNPSNIQSPSSSNVGDNGDTIKSSADFFIKKIVKVKANKLIAEDNTEWTLYNAIPGVEWRCIGPMGEDGVVNLENPIDAFCITDGTNNVALGVNGATHEFEIRIICNDTKVIIQKEFVSIQTPHLLKQGLEEK